MSGRHFAEGDLFTFHKSKSRALLTFIVEFLQLCLLKGIHQSLILLYSLFQFKFGEM